MKLSSNHGHRTSESAEAGTTAPISLERKLEQLDFKIESLRELFRICDSCSVESSHAHVLNELTKFCAQQHELLFQAEPGLRDRYARLLGLNTLQTPLSDEEELANFSDPAIIQTLSAASDERRRLLEEPALDYAHRLGTCVTDLIAKHALVQAAKAGDFSALHPSPEKAAEIEILSTLAQQIQFKPFCINMLFSSEDYDALISQSSSGTHYSGSPVNAILNDSDCGTIIRHEELHNMTDLLLDGNNAATRVRTTLALYRASQGLPDAGKQILSLSVANLLDLSQSEVISEAEARIFSPIEKYRFREVWLGVEHTSRFSTAGNEIEATAALLSDKTGDLPEDLSSHCHKLARNLLSGFNKMVSDIRKVAYAASVLEGSTGEDEMIMGLIALKPSEYGLLKTRLEARHGSEVLGKIERIFESLDGPEIEIDLKSVADWLVNFEYLDQQQRQRLTQKFDESNIHLAVLPAASLDESIALIVKVKELWEKFEQAHEPSSFLERLIINGIDSEMSRTSPTGFRELKIASLEELLSQCEGRFRNAGIAALADYFLQDHFESDLNQAGITMTSQELLASSIPGVLTHFGLQERVLPLLQSKQIFPSS